jgi:LacI family transcriptional regulator
MNRRPTILDVAARAGVSKSTVSLVLQGSSQVRPATQAAVRAAMSEIGYVYNRAAANLRAASVGLVGVVVHDLRDPLITEITAALQMALAAQGYATLIAHCDDDPDVQAKHLGSMLENGVAGLVIAPVHGEAGDSFDRLAHNGLPVIQILRKGDERTDLFPFASFDYAAGGLAATRHLIEQGARSIAFLGGLPGRAMTRERKAGWREALKAQGIAEIALHGKANMAFGAQMAETLLAEHPGVDAALCYNDRVALGLMAGLARAGRPLGSGFRLVAFGDGEDAAPGWPPISLVACDTGALARDTAERLIAWMTDNTRPAPEIRNPVRFVPRASSLGDA